jgi:hypothetical protein
MDETGDNGQRGIAIIRSTRHAKITGDFGEALILYWLSKDGFECARLDHTGMDLIARNPHNEELMGISVKMRSRVPGNEGTNVKIKNSDEEKLRAACEAFRCQPYFAIVVDEPDTIRCFLMNLGHLKELTGDRKHLTLDMREIDVEAYRRDPQMIVFEFSYTIHSWWGSGGSNEAG